jgi:hypothetical protein
MRADPPPPHDRSVDLQALERRARAAYERGRLRHALVGAWPVLALAALALGLGGRAWAVGMVAAMLLVVVVAFLHRGGAAARAVVPGLLGGSPPMLAWLLSCRVPHGCAGPGCTDRCMLVCFTAALLGAAFLARRCQTMADGRREALLAGGAVAALVGGMGCIVLGAVGLSGLALGLLVIAVPVLFLPAPR